MPRITRQVLSENSANGESLASSSFICLRTIVSSDQVDTVPNSPVNEGLFTSFIDHPDTYSFSEFDMDVNNLDAYPDSPDIEGGLFTSFIDHPDTYSSFSVNYVIIPFGELNSDDEGMQDYRPLVVQQVPVPYDVDEWPAFPPAIYNPVIPPPLAGDWSDAQVLMSVPALVEG